jgi:hypothetical protein
MDRRPMLAGERPGGSPDDGSGASGRSIRAVLTTGIFA